MFPSIPKSHEIFNFVHSCYVAPSLIKLKVIFGAPIFFCQSNKIEVIWDFKFLEYFHTCNMFYVINGPRVTFGIFDCRMLKNGILSYQTT